MSNFQGSLRNPQATGMDAGMAGNWVQLIIFLGICIGWVSTYFWRVATKAGVPPIVRPPCQLASLALILLPPRRT